MKHREKPKYSVRQNVCFMVRTAWEKRRRVLLLCVVVAAIKVALDLAQLYVTPEILTRVEQGVPVGELLTTIGFFTVALLLLRGTNRFFRGMNCSSHSCGSSISVVNAPSSLLRLMYPSSRSTMVSMRTRPKPCPSPLVLRNSPPSFCIFFPAVKLVKEM